MRLSLLTAASIAAITAAYAADKAEKIDPLPPAATRAVDFAAEVRPILEASCIRCHGPEKQEGELRLDTKKDALRTGESAVVVPGKSGDSMLIKLVAGLEADRLMPAEGKRLSREQIGILRAWIDQGAKWPDEIVSLADKRDWWSLRPIKRPTPPELKNEATLVANSKATPVANSIDAFVLAKLRERGFSPAPPAERRDLLRRVTFDLTGLPPSPDEVEAFVADARPDAYERVVERLLASPRYGERWARRWMDVVHFAETHGHDQDRVREHAWPYRDYLIAAFNGDRPYARFVEEQIAGDVLWPDDPQAIVATGFLAAGPWDESSLRDIREDVTDRKIGQYLDRDDIVTTVMQTFASSTVQCARCHDHKFDPISQADYYALQAVFAGIDKANRKYDADPKVAQKRRDLTANLAAVARGDSKLLAAGELAGEIAALGRALKADAELWKTLPPESFASDGGATLTPQADGSLLYGGKRPDKDTYTIIGAPPVAQITAVRLEVLCDDSLPHRGPGRQDNGNLHLSEVLTFLDEAGKSASTTPLKIAKATADFDQEGWGVARAIDGQDPTAWGIYPQVGQPHVAAFELAERLTVPAGGKLRVVLRQLHGDGHLIGRARLSVSAGDPALLAPLPADLHELLAIDAAKRTAEQQAKLAQMIVTQRLQRELTALPKQQMVYAGASDFEPDASHRPTAKPRPVHLLTRGDILQPQAEARPGTIGSIASLPARFDLPVDAAEGQRRAALARWLSDPKNPLTWRSIVNRAWHYHFGRGLVDTPNDLGRMGSQPSHAELLDWLAAWFRDDARGSLKALDRLIVTSATYRQSVRHVPEYAQHDAGNRWLWRANRQRLDAESIRDAVLAFAGRLDLRMGGPSDRQFELKPGIHVTPLVDYSKFDLDSDASRRSVYRFLFRTLPDPLMDALDCPAGDQSAAVRNASVTVQQSLALWNSAFMARQAEHFAARVEQGGGAARDKVDRAVRLAYCRPASDDELASLAPYVEKHGLANLCRVLLNANEFLFLR